MNENELLDRFKQGQRNFSKLMLRRAKLAKAELSLVTFDEANLEHSNFHSAQLAGANFIHARLGDVNFSFANLLGANFFKAQLRKANFTNALVSGGEFLAADLRQANFTNASCVGIDFSGANLQDTDFSNANLQQANLTGANLLGADLTGADLEGTSLEGAVMPDGSVLNFASDDQDVTQLENAAAPVAQQSVASESQAPVEANNASSDANALIPILRFGDLDLDVQGNFFNPLDPEQAANPSGADTNADTNAAPSVASEANTSAELQPPLTQPLESDDVNTRLEMAPTSSTSEPATQSESPTETYSLGRFQLGTSRPIPYHFQQQVLKAYGQRCAMTGNPIQAVLEVIMIQPDAESDQDHPSNGLVLRADLAKLFRLRLIAVIPETLQVAIAPSLANSEYSALTTQTLRLPSQTSYRPSLDLLRAHLDSCHWYNPDALNRSTTADQKPKMASKWHSRFRLSGSFVEQVNQFLQGDFSADPDSETMIEAPSNAPPDRTQTQAASTTSQHGGSLSDSELLALEAPYLDDTPTDLAQEMPSAVLSPPSQGGLASSQDQAMLAATSAPNTSVEPLRSDGLDSGAEQGAAIALPGSDSQTATDLTNPGAGVADDPTEPTAPDLAGTEAGTDTVTDTHIPELQPADNPVSTSRYRLPAIAAGVLAFVMIIGIAWSRQETQDQLTAPQAAQIEAGDGNGSPEIQQRAESDQPINLQTLDGNDQVQLQAAALTALAELQAAAAADGVELAPLGGYQPREDAIATLGLNEVDAASPEAVDALATSGYLDGLGIDLGDADLPESDRNPDFRFSPAYKWLERNGPTYGFFLPFPPNSEGPVDYRPWHWRYRPQD